MPRLADRRLSSFFARASADHQRATAGLGPVSRDLVVAERRLALRVAGTALADALLPALSPCVVEGHGRPVATIAICEAESAVFPWSHGDIGPGGLVAGSDPGGVVAVHETGSDVVTLIDVGARAIQYRVRSATGVPWWERAAPMRIAFHWALGGEGRHLLHAGAVGDKRGAVLLAGGAGSGKTTVALAAAENGIGYLGDDHVVLDAAAHVHAVYSTASVRTSAEGRPKTVVDMTGRGREALPVSAIVVPRVRGGVTRVRPLGGAEALLALAPTTVLQMPFDDGAAFAALAALARHVPCFAIDVGDDPGGIANGVEEVLDRA